MEFDRHIFDDTMREFETRMRDSGRVQEEIQSLSVEAKSDDGLIRLTVGPPGRLQKLVLDPRIKRVDVETVAETITALFNDASGVLQERIAEKVQELLPDFQGADLVDEFRRMSTPPEAR